MPSYFPKFKVTNRKKVKIGDRIYDSMVEANHKLGKSKNYIQMRIKRNNGLMPDGTKIEVIKE